MSDSQLILFCFFLVRRPHLQQYLDEVLTRLSDLMALNSPDNGVKQFLSSDDQLFIYETAGTLIVQSQIPPEVS